MHVAAAHILDAPSSPTTGLLLAPPPGDAPCVVCGRRWCAALALASSRCRQLTVPAGRNKRPHAFYCEWLQPETSCVKQTRLSRVVIVHYTVESTIRSVATRFPTAHETGKAQCTEAHLSCCRYALIFADACLAVAGLHVDSKAAERDIQTGRKLQRVASCMAGAGPIGQTTLPSLGRKPLTWPRP